MKAKLHIAILILILTFLGVASQQQISVANQEIVLQFTDMEVTSQEAQNTLLILKNQLQDLGVDNIHVKREDNGKLKITYYSNVDVANVKEILSKEKIVNIDYAFHKQDDGKKQSSDDKVINYNIDIYEIQNSDDADLGFDGYVLENKSENDRFYDPNVFLPSSVINVGKEDRIFKVTLKVWRSVESSIDAPSYVFPEVRAGPLT